MLNSIEETCCLASTELLLTENLATLEKDINEFSAFNTYSVPASSKESLIENHRKIMTENFKLLARKDFLSPGKENRCKNDGKFVDADERVLNFAREDVF